MMFALSSSARLRYVAKAHLMHRLAEFVTTKLLLSAKYERNLRQSSVRLF